MGEGRINMGHLSLPGLPKRHAGFEMWEYDTRAAINAACPAEFDCDYLFEQINSEAEEPWVFEVHGSGSEKIKNSYRKLNNSLWAALNRVIKEAIAKENDGATTLRWKMFFDQVYKATKKDLLSIDGEYIRKVMPEGNGQFLWCKMRAHVLRTSKDSKHAAMESFQHIRLHGDRVLEFLAKVKDVGEQAGFDDDARFLHIKKALENHATFRALFMTWRLSNPNSIDISTLEEFITTNESQKNSRFVSGDGDRDHRSRYWGAAGLQYDDPGLYGDGEYDEWKEKYGASESYSDESDGQDDDYIWDATEGRESSWQVWNAYWETPEHSFAAAGRFKGRKGKGKGKKGFRRLMPKYRKGKGKGLGKSKGKGWSPYGGKGKGIAVAAPTEEEDWDPFAHYWPESENPLDHIYWCSENHQCVYDPEVTTQPAAAAMQHRKGKKGGGKGKKGSKGKTDLTKVACIKWSEHRCTHGKNCRFSHSEPGGFAPGGKGAALTPEQQTPAGQFWPQYIQQPSGQQTSGQQQPSGQQAGGLQQLSICDANNPSGNAAAAQRAHEVVGMNSVTPQERQLMVQHLAYLRGSRVGASAAPSSSGHTGMGSFPC